MESPSDAHILIVEDDPDTRNALTECFIDSGYLPLAVSDGVEALNHLRAGHRPALIVLDLMLPRIDGWRFLAIVAESSGLAGIPTVVCSGADLTAQPPGVPPDHVLTKPLDVDQLLGFAARYCGAGFSWASAGAAAKRTRKPRATSRRRKKTDQ